MKRNNRSTIETLQNKSRDPNNRAIAGVIRYLDEPLQPGPVPILGPDEAMDLLASARRIAIVGASPDPWRASHSVMDYLLAHGYECVPVNPRTERVLGRLAYPSLEAAVEEAGGPFDIVDVFRRPDAAPDVARSAVATGCRALWLQLRIISWEAAAIAHEGGLRVVMDRCTAIDHRALRVRSSAPGRPGP
jgi:predicted CoA-binding protein